MKIGNNVESIKSDAAIPTSGSARGASPAQPVAAPAAADKVELSGTSLALAGAGGSADGDVRVDKVREVRSAVDAGQFHVAAQAVADRMIREAADLLKTMVSTGGGASGGQS